MEQAEFKKWIIKCPHCGAEYLASEIFMPGELVGKSETVIRDALGKVLYVEWEEDCEPGQVEHYVCDNCDKPFIVEPVLTFKVRKEDETLDFSTDKVSLLD